MRFSIFYICGVKNTGNSATYYARDIENTALSIGMPKPVLARKKATCPISELHRYNELEIIYANIRV